MPSDDFSQIMGGARGDTGDELYTVLAALSAVSLAIALVLVQTELWQFYRVVLFKFIAP